MLLTVKRLGSTNISLRRLGRGLRRLSARCGSGGVIEQTTLAQLLCAGVLPRRSGKGVVGVQIRDAAHSPLASRVDVVFRVDPEAVARNPHARLLRQLDAGRIAIEEIARCRGARASHQEYT